MRAVGPRTPPPAVLTEDANDNTGGGEEKDDAMAAAMAAASAATTVLQLDRRNILRDTFQSFGKLQRSDLEHKLRIDFTGEVGIDSGGITDDWYVEVTRALLDPSLCLFSKVDSGGDLYTINPLSGVQGKVADEYFHFFGRFLGKMAFDRRTAEVPFCASLLKQILGQQPTLACLAEIDPVKHQSLQWVLHNDITDVIYETFAVVRDTFGEQKTIDLCPGGRSIEVVEGNKAEWVTLVVEWELGGCVREQLDSLILGFHELVPPSGLAGFDTTDLELLLRGPRTVDVWRVRSFTKYAGEGLSEASATVQFFWETFETFDDGRRSQVLKFCTGCTCIPLDGFEPAFTIVKSSLPTNSLPTSHTCFNQLVLPEYSSREELEERLSFALQHSTDGFQMS